MLRVRHMDKTAPRARPFCGAGQGPVKDGVAHIGPGILGVLYRQPGVPQRRGDGSRPGASARRRSTAGDLPVQGNDTGGIGPLVADKIDGVPLQPESRRIPMQTEMHGDIGRNCTVPVIDEFSGAGKFTR